MISNFRSNYFQISVRYLSKCKISVSVSIIKIYTIFPNSDVHQMIKNRYAYLTKHRLDSLGLAPNRFHGIRDKAYLCHRIR